MTECERAFGEANRVSRRSGERGSTLFELAITIGLFLLMLFGIVDFGRAAYTYHFLSNAARQATRWAAVNGGSCGNDGSCNGTGGMNNGPASQADVQTYVQAITPPGIDASKVTATACGVTGGAGKCADSSASCTLNEDGCMVQIKVSYTFNFLVPLVRKGAIPMSSTSEMVIVH
jgi:Flp pilus assembly protein TadG